MVNKNIIDVQNAKFIVTNNQFFGIDCTNPRAKLQIGDGPELSTNPILFQVADTLAVIKEGNKKRVGIGKYPEEDLDIDGNIRISSSEQEKITFFNTGHQHEHGKLLFTDDGIGSQFQIFTKNATNLNVEQTFAVNNKGAIGISTNPNFGTDGQFLISKGTNQSAEWITLQGGTGVNYNNGTISIGQDVGVDSGVTFSAVNIRPFVGNPLFTIFMGATGLSLNNTTLAMSNSDISIAGNQGTPGQTLKSNGTNPIFWGDTNVNLIWTPYFEPFGLANIGGLVTMDNRTAYYSSFYTSSALSYDKIILYTTESTVSFTGHIGVGIFDSNNSFVGTNKLQEAIVEYTNALSSGEEILINFPSSVTLDSNTKYWVGIAVDSTNTLGIAKASSVDTDNIHIRKEVSANFDSSGFGSVVSTTNSDLNFWYRLYNSQITSFNDFTDTPDSLSIFKTNSSLLEAKIETETDVSGTGSAILFETLDLSNVLTERLRVNRVGAIGISGANYGVSGAVLTSQGTSAAPIWSAPDKFLYKLVPNTTNASTITSLIANDFTTEDTWWYEYQTDTYSDGAAHGRGSGAFQGAVVAPNGNIILVPYNSTNIGIYDPTTKNYSNGPAHGRGSGAFMGGVLAPNGNIILVPFNSIAVGIYNPITNNYSDIALHGQGATAFHGGVLAPNGNIILVPFNSTNIGIYDPTTHIYIPGATHGRGSGAFIGGVLAPNGNIILVPFNSTVVGIYDPITNNYTNSSGPAHGQGSGAFVGGVLAPNGDIILVPGNSTDVGIYDPIADNYSNGAAHVQGNNAFYGGALAPNGDIILVPLTSTNIGIYNPTTNNYTPGPAHGRGNSAFTGGVLGPNGLIILAPFNSSVIGIYGINTKPLLNDQFEKNVLLPYFNKF